METKNITQSAAIAALICVAGMLAIYVGPIPLLLATGAVCLAGLVLGQKKDTIAEKLHLLIEKGRKEMKTKDMTLIAMMAALICVAGPLTIPVGPIPLSLATFAVYLAGSVLGSKKGTIAVGLYLMIGIIGVPVFSGFSGGFQKLAGVTGGYLVGYLPCAYMSGEGAEKRERIGWWYHPLMMIAGTALLYLVGTVNFMLHTGNGLGAALALCVVPFLIGDAVKIAGATLITQTLKKAISVRMKNEK